MTTVPVDGLITFDGGECPAAGIVYFSPTSVADGLPRRPAFGNFDRSGKFTVTSFAPNDGLVPGKYQVRIECWRIPPTDTSKGVSYLSADLQLPEITIDPSMSKIAKPVINVPTAQAGG